MAEDFFKEGVCSCGSENIAVTVVHPNVLSDDPYPPGTECFWGCRECTRWQSLLSIVETKDIWDEAAWDIAMQGIGTFSGLEERESTIVWRKGQE